MFSVRIDVKGEYELRWPLADSAIIALGELYVAREVSLPSEQKLLAPALPMVQAVLAQAQTAMQAASSGEVSRAVASELYHQAMETARPLLDLVIARLKGKYAEQLAQLEAWGLHTNQGVRGVNVMKPRNENEWADFLVAYVAREQSLEAEARVAHPPLAQMAALAVTAQANREGRRSSQTHREINVEARTAVVAKLLGLLQTAALVLMVIRGDGKVKPELQAWGYDIVARTAAAPSETPPPAAPPP